MNNNPQPTPSTDWLPKTPKLRVEREHGGENVEEIDVSQLVSVNDAGCKHASMSRDPSETEFVAYTCDNPSCGMVYIESPI
jgi:hypothetical protein